MDVVLRGKELRGLVVELGPGEWYAKWNILADTRRTIRLGDVDRIHIRPTPNGKGEELWVSGHKEECGLHPGHRGCVAEYVALVAVERALVAKGAGR